jgi:hypothetical protein
LLRGPPHYVAQFTTEFLTAARIKITAFCSVALCNFVIGTHDSEEPAAFIFRVKYVHTASSSETLVSIYLTTRCYIPEDPQSICYGRIQKPNLFQICCLTIQLKHGEGNTDTPSPLSVEFMHFVEITYNTHLVMEKEKSTLVPVHVQCGTKPNTPLITLTVLRPFVYSIRYPKKRIPGMTDITCNSELNLRLHTVIPTRKHEYYVEPPHVGVA